MGYEQYKMFKRLQVMWLFNLYRYAIIPTNNLTYKLPHIVLVVVILASLFFLTFE